jgi:PQQ-dependent catabolism-associated CXXCW motif protein
MLLIASGPFVSYGLAAGPLTREPWDLPGGWNGRPIFSADGALKYCLAIQRPKDANSVWFGVGMLPSRDWVAVLQLKSWHLEVEKAFYADVTFDAQALYHLPAKPTDEHTIFIVMQGEKLVQQFRRSQVMSVLFNGQLFSFSLDGTSRLFPALADCVRSNTAAKPEPPAEQQPPIKPESPVDQQSPIVFYGDENVDFKVPEQNYLKKDVGSPTPLTIPGIPKVTTVELMEAIKTDRPMVLIDALAIPHEQTIKGAISLPYAGAFGNFRDSVQTRITDVLNALLLEHAGATLIFFCQGIECWESYNAALRARAAGFKYILWYRGGLRAWKAAGFPMQSNQMQGGQ